MTKGLTPVLATVLLMTISIAATGSAYLFLSQTQQNAQEAAKDTIQSQTEESSSSINMEYVYNGTDGHTILRIRNTGDTSVALEGESRKLLNVYVNGRPVGTTGRGWKYLADSITAPVGLEPKQSKAINTTKQFPLESETQVLKVTGPEGVKDTHSCFSSGTNSC